MRKIFERFRFERRKHRDDDLIRRRALKLAETLLQTRTGGRREQARVIVHVAVRTFRDGQRKRGRRRAQKTKDEKELLLHAVPFKT